MYLKINIPDIRLIPLDHLTNRFKVLINYHAFLSRYVDLNCNSILQLTLVFKFESELFLESGLEVGLLSGVAGLWLLGVAGLRLLYVPLERGKLWLLWTSLGEEWVIIFAAPV